MNAEAATCPSDETLADYRSGSLPAAEQEGLSRHLQHCARCRDALAIFVQKSAQAVHAPTDKPRFALDLDPPPGLDATALHMPADSAVYSHSSHETPTHPPAAPTAELRSTSMDELVSAITQKTDYEVIKQLGRGGMGTVYLARNRIMDRQEVLKVVSSSHLGRPEMRERFHREIRAAARLAHPNIVAAYSVIHLDDVLVMAMEYVRGLDLARVVKQNGPLPVTNAAYYAHAVTLGLAHAHERKMVHRDIKPSNLMLAIEAGRHVVKILDFGLAKATSDQMTSAGLTQSEYVLGTPEFMAPEQALSSREADIRADVYSLGCTLYFLLTGQAPFRSKNPYDVLEMHRVLPRPLVTDVRPGASTELAAVVSKMMAKDPAERYQTPADAARALRPFFRPSRKRSEADEPLLPPRLEMPPADDAPVDAAPTSNSLLLTEAVARHPIPPVGAPVADAGPAAALPASASAPPPRRAPKRPRPLSVASLALPVAVVALVYLLNAPGMVTIVANVPRPEIWVDGERTEMLWDEAGTRGELHLAVGRRAIELRKAGYHAASATCDVARGETASIAATLELLEPPLAIAPFDASQARAHQQAWAQYLHVSAEQKNSLGMEMMLVPPGEFAMGSTPAELAAALALNDVDVPASNREAALRALEHESPQHRVRISKPLWMSRTELTVGQFRRFADAAKYVSEAERRGGAARYDAEKKKSVRDPKNTWRTPGLDVTDESPVMIEAEDAMAFCNWLSEQEGLQPCYEKAGTGWKTAERPSAKVAGTLRVPSAKVAGTLRVPSAETGTGHGTRSVPATLIANGIATFGYRLPTEAEWEYACRAGTASLFYSGDDVIQLERYDWYGVCSGRIVHHVGQKLSNPFGLFDMHGNVHEWCQDWYASDYYGRSPTVDPTGPDTGTARVVRGGCFYADRKKCRSSNRLWRNAESTVAFETFGARIVRELAPVQAEATKPAGTSEARR